jgi:thiol-disulfide isomerase/thioredoxin
MNTLLIAIIILIVLVILNINDEQNNFTNEGLKKIDKKITSKENEILLLFFYVNWCKYSQEGIPQWLKIQNKFEGKQINGYTIKVRSIDCEGNELEQYSAKRFKINQYPTIKIVKNKKMTEYNYEITPETMEIFIKTKI